jgi:N-terminal region of glycosyl transferase group 7
MNTFELEKILRTMKFMILFFNSLRFQNLPTVFNKAAMMNIGFLEAQKRFPEMNCVMFHDVDLLLEDDRALMTCGPEARHFAATLDRWNYT